MPLSTILITAILTNPALAATPASTAVERTAALAQANKVMPAGDAMEKQIPPASKGLPSLTLFPKPFPTGVVTLAYRTTVPQQDGEPANASGAQVITTPYFKRRYFHSDDPLMALSIDTRLDEQNQQSSYTSYAREWNGLVAANQAPILRGTVGEPMIVQPPENRLVSLKVTEDHWLPLRPGSSISATLTTEVQIAEQGSYQTQETMHCGVATAIPAASIYPKWHGEALPLTCSFDNGEGKRQLDYVYIKQNGYLMMTRSQTQAAMLLKTEVLLLDARFDTPAPIPARKRVAN